VEALEAAKRVGECRFIRFTAISIRGFTPRC